MIHNVAEKIFMHENKARKLIEIFSRKYASEILITLKIGNG